MKSYLLSDIYSGLLTLLINYLIHVLSEEYFKSVYIYLNQYCFEEQYLYGEFGAY